MAVGDNAADNAPVVAGVAFFDITGLSCVMTVDGTTKDDDVVVEVEDVVGAVLLMLVGTDDARIVAVGETGMG